MRSLNVLAKVLLWQVKKIFVLYSLTYKSFNLCSNNSVFPVPDKPCIETIFLEKSLYINLVWSPSKRIIFF